jgi:hypothetical protein
MRRASSRVSSLAAARRPGSSSKYINNHALHGQEKKDEIVVKHRNHKGEPVERVFSKEVHGDNFEDLANEYKKTNKASLIDEPEDTDEDETADYEE